MSPFRGSSPSRTAPVSPVSPTLADGFFTTVPPGKPNDIHEFGAFAIFKEPMLTHYYYELKSIIDPGFPVFFSVLSSALRHHVTFGRHVSLGTSCLWVSYALLFPGDLDNQPALDRALSHNPLLLLLICLNLTSFKIQLDTHILQICTQVVKIAGSSACGLWGLRPSHPWCLTHILWLLFLSEN